MSAVAPVPSAAQALLLRLRDEVDAPVDCRAIDPARLADADTLAGLRLPCGGRERPLSELFEVDSVAASSPGAKARIAFASARGLLVGVGAGMTGGTITVRGDVGDDLGRGMVGGQVFVDGSAGDGVARGMAGGELFIGGSTGRDACGPELGERDGMRGGRVLVLGDVGARAGLAMRRGELLVGGDAAPGLACEMVAGTIAVLGRLASTAAEPVGARMRRGTVLCAEPLESVRAAAAVTFNDGGESDWLYLALLARSWGALDARLYGAWTRIDPKRVSAARLVGDRGADGRGELVAWPALRALRG